VSGEVLRDTIQPFRTFSEIYADALKAFRGDIAAGGGSTWSSSTSSRARRSRC
jgi:hypothetical protein